MTEVMDPLSGRFHYGRYLFRLRFPPGEKVSGNVANTLRGALGYHLAAAACPCPPGGSHVRGCVYGYMFETPPPPETSLMRKYPFIPHPFTLYTAGPDEEGACAVEIVLVGRGNDFFPYFVYAFLKMGSRGVGKRRVRFRLEGVRCGDEEIYDGENARIRDDVSRVEVFRFSGREGEGVRIRFLSPCSLVRDGRTLRVFDFRTFAAALLRRVQMLSYFHNGFEPDIDFRGLLHAAERECCVAEDRTEYLPRTRHSTRQERRMGIGGIAGEVTVRGNVNGLLPYLELGEIVHAGKKTSFGNGKYVLELV